MLTIQVFHIRNHLFLPKQRVQEVNEQVLVGLGTKNTLETEIGQQANISFFCYMTHTHNFLLQNYAFPPTSPNISPHFFILTKENLVMSSKSCYFAENFGKMERYDKERLVEIVLYVLNKTGELYYYTLLKNIYFAELKHLAKWGQRITADEVCAMPYGPVLSHLLDAIKGDSHEPELSRMLKSAFKFASEDASNIMLPLRQANEDYLSESEKEALDASIQENASLSFEQLKNKSHDKIWLKNYREGKGKKVIAMMDLAVSAHASDAMKEYIKENLEIERALA